MKRSSAKYTIVDIELFKNNLVDWSSQFQYFSVLKGQSSSNYGLYLERDMLVGVDSLAVLEANEGSFEKLKSFSETNKDWLFGAFSYDLKNEIESLKSENVDFLDFPNLLFFQPKWVFEIKGSDVWLHFPADLDRSHLSALFKQIMFFLPPTKKLISISKLDQRVSKEHYFQNFNKIIENIKRGDIYEMNYCIEFFSINSQLDMLQIFNQLDGISEAPFSAYFRANNHHLACSSPERFLKKTGSKLISQPIKGTKKRDANIQEDKRLKQELLNCPKERSENVMIVDLVRNDLSKTAKKSSVQVEELFGVYSFKQVHQMISTITSMVKDDVHWVDAIKNAFPMGSMTGAPKIMAMNLIENYESNKRGLYSGSVGYVTPENDFDFNVIIRSILHNDLNMYSSFMVGGAITAKSDPQKEYEECLLKAKAMLKVLNVS